MPALNRTGDSQLCPACVLLYFAVRKSLSPLLQAFGKSATASAAPAAGAKKGSKAADVAEEDTVQLSFFGKVKAFLGAPTRLLTVS